MSRRTVTIRFGAMAPPIRAQLEEQHIMGIPHSLITSFQHDADALTRLAVRGMLPDRAVTAARKRLIQRIRKQIME